MLNHVALVGKVVNQFECTIVLDVDNEYIAVSAPEDFEIPKLNKGDIVGIRGKVVEHQQVIFDKITTIKPDTEE